MDWHEFRSTLIWSDNRFSLSHTDIQSPVYAHLPSSTHAQTAFQYLTQKHPRAHTQLFEISWLYKHGSPVYLKRHRYLLLLAKIFSKNSKVAVKWGSLHHLKIRKENIDYTFSRSPHSYQHVLKFLAELYAILKYLAALTVQYYSSSGHLQ